MLGLFGTLNLGARSLSVQRQGAEVAGHNLANVNNPAYARQRLSISTALAIHSPVGAQGTGVDAVAVVQLRSALLDQQIQNETSVRGALEAQQRALQYAQANLGQQFDSLTMNAEGVAAASGLAGQHGLAESMSEFFNALQSLAAHPTALSERQVALAKAQNLATQFSQVAGRLQDTRALLNESLQADLAGANRIIADIAKLNGQITAAEIGGGTANDLRDLRQQKFEELARLVRFTTVAQPNGSADVVIAGVSMTRGAVVDEQLEAYDAGGGRLLVRAKGAGAPLTLTGGSVQGSLDARDGALAKLEGDLDSLAAELVKQVNAIHRQGFSLTGSTGEDFFTGSNAADIRVNPSLLNDPSRLQASGRHGAVGDNQVALQLAQLAHQRVPALGGATFGESYAQRVAELGQALASVNSQLGNQDVVHRLLLQQRDSVSGVSLDEEMTDLIRFQKAFEASARLIATLDEMLETVVSLKR